MSLKENLNEKSSPFQAPNYTQIPNVIFDEWMPILAPTSFKVLLCICRKTFGWHKSEDTISRNQLMKYTGITSKATIKTALDDLVEKRLVFRISTSGEYGNCPNSYSLNIVKPLFETDDSQNLGGGRSKFDLGVGQNLTGGVGQNLTPQKKPSTKESSVCSSSPPASQAPPVSGDSEPEKPSLEKPKKETEAIPPLIISDFDGTQTKVSIEDLFTHAVLKRKSWASEEIRECWNILADYNGAIRDVYHFVDGTIKKMRTIRKSEAWAKKKAKEERCKKTKNEEYKSTYSRECTNSQQNSSAKYADPDTIKRMFDSLK